jgi:outer membrane protein assembly factor BamB
MLIESKYFSLRRYFLMLALLMTLLSGFARAEEKSGWFSDDQAEWLIYKGNYGRTSALDPDVSLPLEVVWKKKDTRSIGQTPCAADSFIFVSSRDRRLLCYHCDTGRQVFLRTFKGAISGAVIIRDLKLYFQTDLPDGYLYVTDINTKQKHQRRAVGPADIAPILEKDQIFLFVQTGKAACYNPETGVREWQTQLKGLFEYAPVFQEPYIYVATVQGVIYKIEVEYGREIGHIDLAHTLLGDLASDGKNLYLGLADGRIACVSMDDLKVIWEVRTGEHLFCGPSLQDGKLYLASREGNLLRLDSSDGAQEWKTRLHGVSVCTPTLAGDYVFTATKSGEMAAFDKNSGKRLWQNLVKEGFSASPLVYGQQVFYCSDRGTVYALRHKEN